MRIKIANWLTGSDLLEAGEGSGSSNAQISQANLKILRLKQLVFLAMEQRQNIKAQNTILLR